MTLTCNVTSRYPGNSIFHITWKSQQGKCNTFLKTYNDKHSISSCYTVWYDSSHPPLTQSPFPLHCLMRLQPLTFHTVPISTALVKAVAVHHVFCGSCLPSHRHPELHVGDHGRDALQLDALQSLKLPSGVSGQLQPRVKIKCHQVQASFWIEWYL